MRILIAPDAFKGTLTAIEAADAMAAGIRFSRPEAEIVSMPLADGGEGTLEVIHARCGGKVQNNILYFDEYGEPCGLIESARLIGLNLPDMQIDILERGSAKLGAAILSGLDAGAQNIRIALGGSATVDGGLGLLAALGCRVLNDLGEPVSLDLSGMMQADKIDTDGLDPRLKYVGMTILCDVQNPLCGKQGAVYLYGPQKGLQINRLSEIEAAMRRWACLCEQSFGISVMHGVGTGAAGGLGFALKLLGGQTVSGAEYVMAACDFDRVVKTVDWVVTGEGKSDAQSLHGKLPIIVAAKARRQEVKTVLISGIIEQADVMKKAFDAVRCSCPVGVSVNQAMCSAGPLLQQAAAEWADSLN